ncbi:hypothetical protein B0H14DRAFT_3143395 [Mycena olivaceomarginata]|nr:hypothetical protein B0H14DRAFT_3143395 [Mycena olivaceomarginata]
MRFSSIISLLFSIQLCAAFSWRHAIESTPGPGDDNRRTIESPRGDKISGLGANRLEEYVADKRAAVMVKSQEPDCFASTKDQIPCGEMTEDQKTGAAISMTLCEIAKSGYSSIPLECDMDDISQGECLRAIQRSLLHWTAYVTFKISIVELCFAYRSSNDIDTAKDTYRNATVETMEMIKIIIADKKADLEERTLRAAHTSSNLAKKQYDEIWEDATVFLETSLATVLDNAFARFENQTVQALERAKSTQRVWIELMTQFGNVKQEVLLLSDGISDAKAALEDSRKLASVVKEAQESAVASAANIAAVLAQMNATTHESMEQLNISVTRATESLSHGHATGLIWLMQKVLDVNPSTVAYLRVVSSFVNFIFGSLFSLLMLVYTCSAALANIMAGILGHKPSEDRGQEQELVVQLRAEIQRLEEEMEVQAMCF